MTRVSYGLGGPPAYESRTPRDQNAHGEIVQPRTAGSSGGCAGTADYKWLAA